MCGYDGLEKTHIDFDTFIPRNIDFCLLNIIWIKLRDIRKKKFKYFEMHVRIYRDYAL